MLQALAELAKERPADPVDFVAQYLLKNNPNKQWHQYSMQKLFLIQIIT